MLTIIVVSTIGERRKLSGQSHHNKCLWGNAYCISSLFDIVIYFLIVVYFSLCLVMSLYPPTLDATVLKCELDDEEYLLLCQLVASTLFLPSDVSLAEEDQGESDITPSDRIMLPMRNYAGRRWKDRKSRP